MFVYLFVVFFCFIDIKNVGDKCFTALATHVKLNWTMIDVVG